MSLILTQQGVSTQTHFQYGAQKLRDLCDALGFGEKTELTIELFRSLIYPWGETAIGKRPQWPSDIGDDHTPFEFSLALSEKQPELRILLESQGVVPTLQSQQEAGIALTEKLIRDFDIAVERLRLVEDLFFPEEPEGIFAVWHAVSLRPDKEPEFKIYLNPQAQGEAKAAAIMEEALDRLGFSRVWPAIAEIAARRGPEKDEFKYFSLDLSGDKAARVKLYVRHHDATVEDLEIALSAASNYVKGDVTEFCQGMAGSTNLFSERSVTTCFSFVDGDDYQPSKGTLDFPLSAYIPNDQVACDRIYGYLAKHNLPSYIYERSLQAFATRSLEEGRGMHSYVSFRRQGGCPRVTIYLAPEAYKVMTQSHLPIQNPLGFTAASKKQEMLPSPEGIVAHYKQHPITNHPFFQRLRREPVNLTALWILIANSNEGIAKDFASHLINLITRISDARIRCILIKQLNDEMGNGDFSQAHSVLFEQFVTSLNSWRPAEVTEAILSPGLELKQRLDEFYLIQKPYEGVGASIVFEIYGEQLSHYVSDEFRRQSIIAPSSLTWLMLHETLELEHIDESLTLARLVPQSGLTLEAMWRGAKGITTILWDYFNAIYRICFT